MSDGEAEGTSPLEAAVARIRTALRRHLGEQVRELAPEETSPEADIDSPLRHLCQVFQLSGFERDVVVLCAAIELDGEVAELCQRCNAAAAQGVPEVNFSLALAVLEEPDWRALSPAAPLRYWRLVEVDRSRSLTLGPLRIDERILHFLTGVQYLDERLAGVVHRCTATHEISPSQAAVAAQVARVWMKEADTAGAGARTAFQLCGPDLPSSVDVAAAACGECGLGLWLLKTPWALSGGLELDLFRRLWERETALAPCALLVEWDRVDGMATADERRLESLVEQLGGPLLLATTERRGVSGREVRTLDVARPTREEQREFWHSALGESPGLQDDTIPRLVFQFDMNSAAIRLAAAEAMAGSEGSLAGRLWESCREQARPRLEGVVQRIVSRARWSNVVLPLRQLEALQELAAQVRERSTVYGEWGFGAATDRGLGISALFAGPSGTGKTLAAEVLAGELNLDLYRVDLSTVVNKYIGETEKNLRRAFDAAEVGGAILLFDEADALFGKRSEVKGSHDRHANIEVSYLLQRVESYRGLSILTSNLKENLDPAFLRRLRFIVQFPFPDAALREQLWAGAFSPGVPVDGLDFGRLAKLTVAGGEIRNIALGATFLAAQERGPVTMERILRATKTEYAKLERTLTQGEVRSWLGEPA